MGSILVTFKLKTKLLLMFVFINVINDVMILELLDIKKKCCREKKGQKALKKIGLEADYVIFFKLSIKLDCPPPKTKTLSLLNVVNYVPFLRYFQK